MPSSRALSPERAVPASRLFERGPLPLVMGIVNATPDSFHAASRVPSADAAVELGLRLAGEGADIIDVGGQSTRPGSDPVPEDAEAARVVPVIERLAARTGALLSVDTDKAAVARLAREAGARVLNDVTALRGDPAMMGEARRFQAVILMHMSGNPKTMQDAPAYGDVVEEVKEFLRERINAFVSAGGLAARVLVDPGIGFGKTLEHNLSLLKHIELFDGLAPVVIGASRKSFLGRIMAGEAEAPRPEDLPGTEARLPGSLGVACWAALKGARVLRVHDVEQTRRALEAFCRVAEAR